MLLRRLAPDSFDVHAAEALSTTGEIFSAGQRRGTHYSLFSYVLDFGTAPWLGWAGALKSACLRNTSPCCEYRGLAPESELRSRPTDYRVGQLRPRTAQPGKAAGRRPALKRGSKGSSHFNIRAVPPSQPFPSSAGLAAPVCSLTSCPGWTTKILTFCFFGLP